MIDKKKNFWFRSKVIDFIFKLNSLATPLVHSADPTFAATLILFEKHYQPALSPNALIDSRFMKSEMKLPVLVMTFYAHKICSRPVRRLCWKMK